MKSLRESQPHYLVLQRRMRESFTLIYMTVLSIIQGVALADLASIVSGGHGQFTIVHWLLVLLTFCVLIYVLNGYMIQSTVWGWIPDFRDGAVPFVFGALELFLNHTITFSISAWLIGLAGISIMGALGTWYMDWRAGKEVENLQLLKYLRSHHLLFASYYLGGAVFLLLLALVTHLVGYQATQGMQMQGHPSILPVVLALLVGASLAGSVLISHIYWRKAGRYASTGRLPGLDETLPDDDNELAD